MIFYEGSFLLLLFLLLQYLIFYLYKKENKKEKILKFIFSALTHDLKTPLSSLKIQLDFLEEKFDPKILKRSQQDLKKIENHLMNTLHLSFIEKDIPKLSSVIIRDYLPTYSHYILDLKANSIQANSLLLSLVFKNIFSNALRHSQKKNPKIYLSSYDLGSKTYLIFKNEGFLPKKISEGTGLFLSKELMKLMKGSFVCKIEDCYTIYMTFKKDSSKISS